jgi:co-chaperonin GroES (HSP10)
MKLSLLHDHVLVRPEALPDKVGELFVVYDRQTSTMFGEVVALGEGPVTSKGVRLPHSVRVGARVIFSPDSGQEVIFEKETLVCLREWDLLAEIL